MRGRISIIIEGLVKVLRRPSNLVIALAAAFLVVLAAVWMSNRELLGMVLFSDSFPLKSKLMILLTSLGGIATNFTPFARTMIMAIAVLFGINLAMVVHYFRCCFVIDRSAGTGAVGIIFGMLGIGCSACGSVVLSAVFGAAFTASVIGFLPLGGLEFGIVGVLVLMVSIYLAAKKISRPNMCSIKPESIEPAEKSGRSDNL